MKKNKIVLLLALVFPLSTLASIIHVPGDQPTIQAGIDAAVNGDTVLVANGTYTGTGNRDIDFNGKAITVRSENGAEGCIIDCENIGYHRGFYFHSGEGQDSVVQGITIKNGFAYGGGGIYCNASSPVITRHVIIDAWSDYLAGGGGILCASSAATITNNVISENFSMGGGGIICHGNPSPLIDHNIISSNRSYWGAGGIYCLNEASPVISNNIIRGNYSSESVGAGGIYCASNASPFIINNIIEDNFANEYGGGIIIEGGASVQITNCTITGNFSFNPGGGIISGSSTVIKNCILWGNTPDQINGAPTITYSDVEGGYAGVGNIDEDPLWVKGPLGKYYLSQIVAGQLQDSPCINAGNGIAGPCLSLPESNMVCGTTRTDVEPDTGIIDMGYHYPLVGIQIPPGHLLEEAPEGEAQIHGIE